MAIYCCNSRYLLQQEPSILTATAMEPLELMHSRLACKLNGYVGATTTEEERRGLRDEVAILCAPESRGAVGVRKPDRVALQELLVAFRLDEAGRLKPQPKL